MLAVQKLYNACKASLVPNGQISAEGLENVRNLLDPLLLSHLLKACVEHRYPSLAQQLHSIIITGDWLKLKFVANHLVNAYAKLGCLETALNVFNKMPERNVMSYNIIIGGYIQSGKLGAAIEVFKKMDRRNSATWNAVITGLIKSEFNEEALRLFAKMHAAGFLPDAYTLGSVLRGCAGLRDLVKGKQVHCYAIRSGLELDLVVGSSMAHMYMRCGILSEGQRVIQSMPVHNIVACNTLIAGLVQNGCATGALDQHRLRELARIALTGAEAVPFPQGWRLRMQLWNH
ncbi:Pentatricopeptide repeat-containing protein [Sesamum alatum]|uniref:Pentatricopeptide repeat-containing protein n=1 Tax=Sesamum alatum TaxID=300844 RepID=A0AAE2CY96_9LAMI|nr:Pentatricopeptide repeat-containing protein [Sesamum alatum]